MTNMLTNLLIGVYVLLTAGALVILKLGSKDGPIAQFVDGRLDFNFTPYTMIGILFYGLSFLLYMYLISKFDLGFIIPLTTALVYVIVFVASFVIFKEAFTALKLAGIALILVGIILLNIKSAGA